MSLLIDPRTKKRKSPIVLYSFLAAVLFLLIYGVFFAVLTDPLYRHVSLGSPLLTTAVHALIVSLCGTAVCCLTFLLPDKRVATYGFAGLAVLFGLFCLAAAPLDAEARRVMLGLIALYGLGPVTVGNAAAWTIYRKLLKKRGAESLASEPIPAAPAKPEAAPNPERTEKETLHGPGPETEPPFPPGIRTPQEEAALFYESGGV